MIRIFSQVFGIFFIIIFLFGFGYGSVYAVGYGESTYGLGKFGVGVEIQSQSLSVNSNSLLGHSIPRCSDVHPIGIPDLFQIDRTNNKARLYFTPTNDKVDSYHVIYGYKEGDERFGGIYIKAQNENQGVQSIVVGHLNPKTSYSFKVVSVNGCAAGEWSNWLTASSHQAKTSIFYRYWEKVTNIFR